MDGRYAPPPLLPDPRRGPWPLVEVSLTELNRSVSTVVRRAEEDGEIAVITRRSLPVAMLLPAFTALAWAPGDLTATGEGRRLSDEFHARESRKRRSAWMHSRPWGPWQD